MILCVVAAHARLVDVCGCLLLHTQRFIFCVSLRPAIMEDYRRRPSSQSVTSSPQPLPAASSSSMQQEVQPLKKVVGALVFFCASSLGAIFVNKACLSHYNFRFPSTLMLLQAALTIILLSVLSRIRPNLVTITPVKPSDYHRIFTSTLFFVANITVGLSALSRVNIPMFSAFRRLTVLFVMGAEYFMLHKTHPKPVVISVFALTFGAFVSALGDVTFTLTGYALVFANNALTAAYLASIKRLMRDLALDPISLLYHTSAMGFPIILAIAFITRDVQNAIEYYYVTPELRESPLFLVALSFVAASAFCVNLSTSICTHVTSPLTTSVAGQVKNVLQSLLGFFSWGYVPTPLNVAGLLVALAGQIAFAMFKYKDTKAEPKTSSKTMSKAAQIQSGADAAEQKESLLKAEEGQNKSSAKS